jgi:hypothetical protein
VTEQTFKLFVGTPMAGGMCCGVYTDSMVRLYAALGANGVPVSHSFIYGSCFVADVRNRLVEQFLETNATHMLFIDSDIGFDAGYVFQMIKLMLDNPEYKIIGAGYPKKTFRWDFVIEAVKKGCDENILPHCVSEPTVGYLGPLPADGSVPFEVRSMGTGFMMIRRDMFDLFRGKYPDRAFGNGRFEYFRAGVTDDEFVSEDVSFCHMMRAIGEKIWLCPWMDLTHVGQYQYGQQRAGVAI